MECGDIIFPDGNNLQIFIGLLSSPFGTISPPKRPASYFLGDLHVLALLT